MAAVIDRPVPRFDPARGLLHNDHFQLGYVCSDIARAEQEFAARFGISAFRKRDNDLPGGGSVSTRTVWIGAMMYELVCGTGPGMEQFSRFAPRDGRAMAFHHFGYLVADDAAWEALEAEISRGGWEVLARGDNPGFGRTCMVWAPELGHCLEYVQPGEVLAGQMNATPCA
jgi:Glyoxalase/Bleomycin resistance protein/Dioxygenase superfamily